MSEQEWPAFRPEFEGHIGSYDEVMEDTDKANGERMEALYGEVLRKIKGGDWRYWDCTHWGADDGTIAKQAAQDLSAYMEDVELAICDDCIIPEFPADWSVINVVTGQLYKSLLGKWGALTKVPAEVITWAGESQEHGDFIAERLEAEQKDQIRRELEAWIKKTKSDAGMNSAISQLGARVKASADDFDTVRGTFVVQNGQINTHTCKLEPHRLEDLNTRITAVAYNPKAKCPRWLNYLETNQPNRETRRYLQKMAGYAMSGDGVEKLIAFLYSKIGDTGKSLFIKVMERVFGVAYSLQLAKGALAPRRDEDGRDPDREDIRGKRFVVGSEFKPGQPMDETFVKQLTGGDGVNTRGNYSREGNKRWQPECLVMIATNHLSRINAEDEAIWNRIQVIPWKVAFPPGHPDRDNNLADKIISEEIEGVLAWVVEGLRMYREEGLNPPSEVVEASLVYRSDADVIQKWVTHAAGERDIVISEEQREMTWKLYRVFEHWCKAEKIKDIPRQSLFKDRLIELGYKWEKVKSGKILKGYDAHHGIAVPDDTVIRLRISK
ncbi:DNA primase family protein [Streptomyces malaysiensis]|uniref:SF3 helicase domain-containing protein n=1 Tax=Streptomyces malaysiensis TaxID=92644 RepID=A0A2J7Z8G2_STRMQ|nr:phage/plasmid primase, P4 family [Streptomyces malaysiensis]PNG96563.1 hypothetical protein SMF913_12588 [Streptomyces malaysiensis]